MSQMCKCAPPRRPSEQERNRAANGVVNIEYTQSEGSGQWGLGALLAARRARNADGGMVVELDVLTAWHVVAKQAPLPRYYDTATNELDLSKVKLLPVEALTLQTGEERFRLQSLRFYSRANGRLGTKNLAVDWVVATFISAPLQISVPQLAELQAAQWPLWRDEEARDHAAATLCAAGGCELRLLRSVRNEGELLFTRGDACESSFTLKPAVPGGNCGRPSESGAPLVTRNGQLAGVYLGDRQSQYGRGWLFSRSADIATVACNDVADNNDRQKAIDFVQSEDKHMCRQYPTSHVNANVVNEFEAVENVPVQVKDTDDTIYAVLCVDGAPRDIARNLTGSWSGEKVSAQRVVDYKSSLPLLTLSAKCKKSRRHIKVAVHFVDDSIDVDDVDGLADRLEVDYLGVLQLESSADEPRFLWRCGSVHEFKWTRLRFGAPTAFKRNVKYTLDQLDNIQFEWAEELYEEWEERLFSCKFLNKSIGEHESVEALTHCLSLLEKGNKRSFEIVNITVDIESIDDSVWGMIGEIVKMVGAGEPHFGSSGRSIHVTFKKSSLYALQEFQFELMIQHGRLYGESVAVRPSTEEESNSSTPVSRVGKCAPRQKRAATQDSELALPNERLVTQNDKSSDAWIWWANEYVPAVIANRKTFGLPTPLTDDCFIELEVFAHDTEQIRRAALAGRTVLHAALDDDAAPSDPELTLESQNKLLREHCVAVLFGEAGQGKTSLLCQWQARLASAKLSERLAVYVRADELWKAWCEIAGDPTSETVSRAVADAAAASVGERLSMNDKRALEGLIKSRGAALLIDAIDEVPFNERSSPLFRKWLSWLVDIALKNDGNLNANDNIDDDDDDVDDKLQVQERPLVAQVVLASRFSAMETLQPLMNKDGVEASCIAPMSVASEQRYVKGLLAAWEKHLEREAPIDAHQVLETGHQIGVRRSPLMLLMLSALHFEGKLAGDAPSLWSTYEAILAMVWDREETEKGKQLPRREWCYDMSSLLGFVCHFVGSKRGVAVVQQYDIALLFELFNRENVLFGDEERLYFEKLGRDGHGVGGDAREASTALGIDGLAASDIVEVQAVSWLIDTLGFVSASVEENVLERRVVFSHRTFQEFLAARALLRCDEMLAGVETNFPRLGSIGVLNNFGWKRGRILADPWWEQVLLFAAAGRNVEWFANKILDLNFEDWCDVLLKERPDPNDVGCVRLVLLMRAVLCAEITLRATRTFLVNVVARFDPLFFLCLPDFARLISVVVDDNKMIRRVFGRIMALEEPVANDVSIEEFVASRANHRALAGLISSVSDERAAAVWEDDRFRDIFENPDIWFDIFIQHRWKRGSCGFLIEQLTKNFGQWKQRDEEWWEMWKMYAQSSKTDSIFSLWRVSRASRSLLPEVGVVAENVGEEILFDGVSEVHVDRVRLASAERLIARCRTEHAEQLRVTELLLKGIPPSLYTLNWLKSLDLSNNRLTKIPSEVCQLTALKNLDLSHNQLTILPNVVGQLTALKALNVSDNQLTTLPNELGQLTALENLDLSHNELTTLPNEVGQLTALESLNLSWNKLTTLPNELGQLTALEDLFLSRNELTTLPNELGQLTALEILFLSHNKLTIPNKVEEQLTSAGVRVFYI